MGENRGRLTAKVCTLVIFLVFAATALLLVLIGARAYRGIAGHMEESNALRACLSYGANKVRGADQTGCVFVEQSAQGPLLVLEEPFEGQSLRTYLYFYEGEIRELLCYAQEPFDPEKGEFVAAAAGFDIRQQGNRLTLQAQDSRGNCRRLTLTLRSQGGTEQ